MEVVQGTVATMMMMMMMTMRTLGTLKQEREEVGLWTDSVHHWVGVLCGQQIAALHCCRVGSQQKGVQPQLHT